MDLKEEKFNETIGQTSPGRNAFRGIALKQQNSYTTSPKNSFKNT
jgi:hypothetical protein